MATRYYLQDGGDGAQERTGLLGPGDGWRQVSHDEYVAHRQAQDRIREERAAEAAEE